MFEVMDWVGEISAVTVSSDQREREQVFVLDRCGVVVEVEIVVGELLDDVEVRTRTVRGRWGSCTDDAGLVIPALIEIVAPESARVRIDIGIEALRGRIGVARVSARDIGLVSLLVRENGPRVLVSGIGVAISKECDKTLVSLLVRDSGSRVVVGCITGNKE